MSDFNYLEVQRSDDGIATVTVARPDQLNALNAEVVTELEAVATDLADDDQLRVVIITGAGRAFVAGADIAAMKEMDEEQAREFGRQGHRAMDAIEQLPVPTIAAVNGFALGGGLELALSCDLIYLSDSARVGLPEVGLGIIPGFGGTQRLGRVVGWQQARRLVFTGTQLSADEALQIGLAVDVVADDELIDEVLDVANTIADQGPLAVRRAKSVMYAGADRSLEEGNQLEIDAFADLWNSSDRKEGMEAFVDKRSPNFEHS